LSPECQVLRLEAGPGDRVRAAEYIDAAGKRQRVEADYFAVACGAVETPRLLLNSSGTHAPEGLANESGLLGRHFMETLYWTSSALHPDPLGSHRGLPSDAICWDFNAPDAVPGSVGGCRFTPAAAEADLAGPINYATRVVGGWGRKHKAAMRTQFGRVLSVSAIGENLPDAGAYVDLDPVAKDDAGLAKARIHAHLAEPELDRLRFMAKTCRAILQAAGAERLIEEYGAYDAFNATHVFGTARMGLDPATSVVDADCRSHRWRNLLIADASVFPSSGGGESPSLTIYALALRAAERLCAHAA
jgi:choline dehydrogenase-like flavoprotein